MLIIRIVVVWGACLAGEHLQVIPCPVMFPAMQIPSVLPPPTRYKRAVETYDHWGLRSPGCSGDGNR